MYLLCCRTEQFRTVLEQKYPIIVWNDCRKIVKKILLSKKFSEVVALFGTIWSFSQTFLVTLHDQGCQMVYFQTQNPNFGTLWKELELEILV
jgi:hypothetical protein